MPDRDLSSKHSAAASHGVHFNGDAYVVKPHRMSSINSSPPRQNGHHLADDIFRCMFVNEKFCILSQISLKIVPKGLIDNNPALF